MKLVRPLWQRKAVTFYLAHPPPSLSLSSGLCILYFLGIHVVTVHAYFPYIIPMIIIYFIYIFELSTNLHLCVSAEEEWERHIPNSRCMRTVIVIKIVQFMYFFFVSSLHSIFGRFLSRRFREPQKRLVRSTDTSTALMMIDAYKMKELESADCVLRTQLKLLGWKCIRTHSHRHSLVRESTQTQVVREW